MNNAKNVDHDEDDDLLPEYDFSGGVRGKHFREMQKGYTVTITHPDGTQTVEEMAPGPAVVVLDPDVQQYFPDSESVNRTLRVLIGLIPAEVGGPAKGSG
jgi:hypothetical protein